MRKRMTLFRIIGSRSIWSYLSLQITCETFWLENSMERWKLPLMSPVKTLGWCEERDIWGRVFHHCCLPWVWYLYRWYLEWWMQAMNGERKNTSWTISYSSVIWSCFSRVKNKCIHFWELFMSLVLMLGSSLK